MGSGGDQALEPSPTRSSTIKSCGKDARYGSEVAGTALIASEQSQPEVSPLLSFCCLQTSSPPNKLTTPATESSVPQGVGNEVFQRKRGALLRLPMRLQTQERVGVAEHEAEE